ncbi:amidohydrolase [Streptomyces caniscabiei]|uniref:amidohydrolase n=1 Tax=Streptomyces caniscabiei TaxID=2746961 RepID=UPI0029AF891A|nr:amidohydrolase [Streptomyces caniscabiei]MDX2602025.1 amidohydrolase [Streptomyces caniscabiei]MDX2737460.1 amidohydrolase [Streptomyces caniscabiei]
MHPPVLAELRDAVRERRPALEQLSLDLHGTPETRFEEHYAVEQLAGRLATAGFEIDKGVAGLPTAFTATHRGAASKDAGTASAPGAPTIALLLEYDALPGIGHGCGHNLIAAGGLTAALAVAAVRPDHPGTLKVIGTPGEEGGGGKILMLERGVFRDVDAALMFHPADRGLRARHALAASHLRLTFHGVAAHAAKSPWDGRSAAAGAQLFLTAVDSLRQFMPPTARVHGIIADGGAAPNVVPDRTEVDIYVREATSAALDALLPRVLAAAEGAALATGTTVEHTETAPRYAERDNNMVLADRLADHAAALGLLLEPPSPANPAGSSDIGNVSVVVPTIHPYVQICDRDTPGHSARMREAARGARAHDATETIATALAALALELLTDPALLAAAHEEFTASAHRPATGAGLSSHRPSPGQESR